jgi:hypothetical protein
MSEFDAYAVVAANGELIVCRTTKKAAEQQRDAFYPGCAVMPLRLVADNDEAPEKVLIHSPDKQGQPA